MSLLLLFQPARQAAASPAVAVAPSPGVVTIIVGPCDVGDMHRQEVKHY